MIKCFGVYIIALKTSQRFKCTWNYLQMIQPMLPGSSCSFVGKNQGYVHRIQYTLVIVKFPSKGIFSLFPHVKTIINQ